MPLSELCSTIIDGTHFTPRYVESGVPFYSVENVTADDFENTKFISIVEHEHLTRRCRPERGDILLTRIGSLGDTKLIDWAVDASIYVSLALLKLRDHVSREYVYRYTKSQYFVRDVEKRSLLNAAPKKINMGEIGEVPVLVPPTIDEQNAIATALKDIDDLIASLDALIAKKRDIKQAVMQQLLTGKTRLPGFATTPMTNSAIGNLPSDWEVRPLGSLGDPVIGLTYRPVDVRETGTLVLRSSNVQDGVLVFDNNVFVDPEVASRALVAKGDILICVRNGSRALIGKCAMISDEGEGMAFGAFMSVFRSPHSDFLFHQFQSNIIQRQIHEHLGATINQITNASLRSFQVPFPVSAEERGAIVTILSDMDAELTGLTVKLSKLNMVREGMMQQLLTGRIRLV